MNKNQEIIDIITILDDYDYIVYSMDIKFRRVCYLSSKKEIEPDYVFYSTFEEIEARKFETLKVFK